MDKNDLREILPGFLTSIVMIAATVSYSAAIFTGPLENYLQVAIGFGLIGAFISAVFFALNSSIRFAIAGPDSKPTAILAVVAAGATGHLGASGLHDADAIAASAVLALMAGTALTGIVLYAFGVFRMGRFVRYMPYPVVGGFMAASGWLLVVGAVHLVTGIEPAWESLGALIQPAHLAQLAAAVLFALAMRACARSTNPWSFPIVLVIGTLLVHVGLHLFGLSVAQGQTHGWLLQAPSAAVIPALWLKDHLHHIDWSMFVRLGADYAALIVVTALTLLLGITSVEVDANLGDDVDVDRELRLNGISNLIAAIPGGMLGTLSLSRTLFNFHNGGLRRLSGLTAAATCLLTLVFGTHMLGYVPVPILGGMLLQLGAVLVDDWLIRGWKRMPWIDFAQVAAIFLMIVTWGFLAGIAAGIVVACVTFAVSSSRIRLVKVELDRSRFSSRVDRSPTQNAELMRHGKGIRIFRLHGFMFFGSADRLVLRVRETVGAHSESEKGSESENGNRCRVILLDFREVVGIDSSAVMSLYRLRQFAERENFTIGFACLACPVERTLRAGSMFSGDSHTCRVFPDLDSALEWAEDLLLVDLIRREEALHSADAWLEREMGNYQLFRDLASYLETIEYRAGDTLFAQGDEGNSLVLLHSDRVSVLFRGPEGTDIRIRSMVQQTMVGEMGLYRARPRDATVKVDQPTIAYRLTDEALEQIEQDNPALAYAFHKFVVRTLADRLDFANREVSALQQ